MSSTRPSSKELSSLASRRRASSRSPAASAPSGNRDVTPSLTPVERGAQAASAMLQGQMFGKAIGGGGSQVRSLVVRTCSQIPRQFFPRQSQNARVLRRMGVSLYCLQRRRWFRVVRFAVVSSRASTIRSVQRMDALSRRMPRSTSSFARTEYF